MWIAVSVIPDAVSGETGILSPLRVLLVEDDDDGRDFFAFVLSRWGATVTAVGSAADALDAFDQSCPDVLVSDIGLPGEDGCELLRRVREFDDARSRVPAVAVTAFSDDDTRARVVEAGYQAHLDKPVEPDRLVAVIAGIVSLALTVLQLLGVATPFSHVFGT